MDRAWLTGKASAAHLQVTRPKYFEVLMEQVRREDAAKAEATLENPGGPKPAPGRGNP